MSFINNDTVALVFLGIVAISGVFVGSQDVTIGALGAIGGYIGSKALDK